ncbi:MAG: HD domain-containing phosphohydrolase [Carboxydocellales bacterium]
MFQKANFGFAIYRVRVGLNKQINIEFLEGNQVFEQITGVTKYSDDSYLAAQTLQTKSGEKVSWEVGLAEVAVTGLAKSYVFYSEQQISWQRVQVYTAEQDYVVVVFNDISEEMGKLEHKIADGSFQIIFEQSGTAMTLLENGLFTKCNLTALKFFNEHELIGRHPAEVSPEFQPDGRSSREKADEMIQITLAKGCHQFDWVLLVSSGEYYFEIMLTALNVLGREVILGVWYDITDRVIAEAELTEKEQKYRSLVQTMEEGLALHEVLYDSEEKPVDYRILEVNPAYYKHTGMIERGLGSTLASKLYKTGNPPYLLEYAEVARTGIPMTFCTYFPPMERHFNISVFSPKPGYFATIFNDITDLKKAKDQLYAEKERWKITLQSIGDAIITTDSIGRVALINKIAEELTGWTQMEAEGKLLPEVFHIINEETRERCINPVEKVLETGMIVGIANHTALIDKDGVERIIADSAAPIYNQQGEILGVVLVFRDVTKEKLKEVEILQLSYHDSLTGLYNRTFFEDAVKRIDTERQLPISVIIGDVNGLKLTNDVFGHGEGDKILQRISGILQKTCRKEDVIARWGGDEFIILLPQTDEQKANIICKRIENACLKAKTRTVQLSMALGHAVKQQADQDMITVIKSAEDWMYRHKLLESKSFRSSVLASLKKTLFEKSNETEEHANRIGNICVGIGRLLGFNEGELDDLRLLAMLHDIGKIAISDSILMKPGPLNQEEWEVMKKHSEIGCRIAQASPELAQLAEGILSHHEKWDGTGYPQGLQGKDIPVLSRVVAIADAYDVMTNTRIYKKPVTHEEAMAEINRCQGSQFDPEIVEAFQKLIEVFKQQKAGSIRVKGN